MVEDIEDLVVEKNLMSCLSYVFLFQQNYILKPLVFI